MRKILVFSFFIVAPVLLMGQLLKADKLLSMYALPKPTFEKQIFKKKFKLITDTLIDDTSIVCYQYQAVKSKKFVRDTVGRKLEMATLNNTRKITYNTTSILEYQQILDDLKLQGFYCEYEKDSSKVSQNHLYQYQDYTVEISIKFEDEQKWYSFAFCKKEMPINKEVHFAEDLLQFTSHEYLVYYFGEKNVKKDFYYFGDSNLVKCSVLLINTKLQVIFIWKDEKNRRNISKLFLGGNHILQSQKNKDQFIAENSWLLKSRIHAGMPLVDVRILNEKNIAFCGGDAPNPGLVFPESSGRVDFESVDVILGCMNCNDEKYLHTKILNADTALSDGRTFFVLTIAIYPENKKGFY